MSNMQSKLEYIKMLSLLDALWWFIENVAEDDPERSEMFFHLRERYREERFPI